MLEPSYFLRLVRVGFFLLICDLCLVLTLIPQVCYRATKNEADLFNIPTCCMYKLLFLFQLHLKHLT